MSRVLQDPDSKSVKKKNSIYFRSKLEGPTISMQLRQFEKPGGHDKHFASNPWAILQKLVIKISIADLCHMDFTWSPSLHIPIQTLKMETLFTKAHLSEHF